MAPQFEAAAGQLAGEARLLKINADTTATPGHLKVKGIPALILFQEGREIARTGGAMPAAALVAWVRSEAARVNPVTSKGAMS